MHKVPAQEVNIANTPLQTATSQYSVEYPVIATDPLHINIPKNKNGSWDIQPVSTMYPTGNAAKVWATVNTFIQIQSFGTEHM